MYFLNALEDLRKYTFFYGILYILELYLQFRLICFLNNFDKLNKLTNKTTGKSFQVHTFIVGYCRYTELCANMCILLLILKVHN